MKSIIPTPEEFNEFVKRGEIKLKPGTKISGMDLPENIDDIPNRSKKSNKSNKHENKQKDEL